MATLAKLLGDRAADELTKTILSKIDAQIEVKRQEIKELESARNTLVGLVGQVNSKRSPDNLFYLDSKTKDGPGHFIEVDEKGDITCSCKGFQYRDTCWASQVIKSNTSSLTPRYYWRYDAFDSGGRRDAVDRWESRLRPRYGGRIIPNGV